MYEFKLSTLTIFQTPCDVSLERYEVGKNTATISVHNVMYGIIGHLHWKYFFAKYFV